MTRPRLTSALWFLLACAVAAAVWFWPSRPPVVETIDPAAVAEASGGRTIEVEAETGPTERDTAAVSGTGGTAAAVRVVYRDRWRTPPAPTCPDGAAPVVDDGVRQVLVPADVPPLAVLPPGPDGRPRPVSVTPDRVVLTYREAEGANAGRTVQDVFAVPERRWGYALAGALSLSSDSLAWEPSALRLSPSLVGSVRYRRLRLGVAVPLASDPRRAQLTLSYRLAGRP